MIVVIRKDTQEPAMRQLAVRLMNQGVRIGRTPGQDADVLTLVGDTWRLDPEGLLALPYVLDVRRITPPYRLAGRAAHPENTVVEVGSARIGAEFCLIAGPCAVESQVQIAGVARRVKAAGAQLLRGGVFKPRTSPYSFQGLGQAGIPLLVDAGQEAGLPVVTEITDPRQLDDLADVDVLQVGARNMQNFPLLQALGQVRKPVLLKRGMSATVTELLQAAEYILAGGNSQVILCERGIRTFETDSRATLDIAAIPVLKRLSPLPVIVDPSHAAGRAELVAPLALAAQLQDHSLARVYEAVAVGSFREDSGTVDAPIGRHPTDRKKMAVYPASEPHTKYAYTGYKVLERFGGFTLLECRLKTGRTHQIRVHMASIQHPVAGDPVYGPHNCITKLHGQCLHAKTLGFIHPITGEHLRFDSELPEYFTHFIVSLRRGTV